MFVVKEAGRDDKDDDGSDDLEDCQGGPGDETHLHELVVQQLCRDDVLGDPASVANAFLVLHAPAQERCILFPRHPLFKNRVLSFLCL